MAHKITRLILVFLALSGAVFAQNNRAEGILNASATSCSGTAQITASCLTIIMPPDAAGVGAQLSGTFSATAQFEGTVDGTTWVSIPGTAAATGVPVTSATSAGLFQFPSAALVGFRVRLSSYASGAVQAVIQSGLGAPVFNTTFATQNIASTDTLATAASPAAVSAGTALGPAEDLTGNVFVRLGGPNQFQCYARGVAAALADFTQITGTSGCGSVTPAGFKLYVTDITAQSTTTTGGTFRISYGTGAACVTTNNAIFPANTGDTFTYPPSNANQPFQVTMTTPLIVPATNRLCVFGTATNTLNINVNGFIAP